MLNTKLWKKNVAQAICVARPENENGWGFVHTGVLNLIGLTKELLASMDFYTDKAEPCMWFALPSGDSIQVIFDQSKDSGMASVSSAKDGDGDAIMYPMFYAEYRRTEKGKTKFSLTYYVANKPHRLEEEF